MKCKKNRILIIDDEPHIRLLYKEELEEAGYEVSIASNTKEGLLLIDTFKPDLLILDIKLSGESGLEFLKKVKLKYKKLKVLLCTAYHEFKQHYLSWTADDYIVKSTSFEDIKKSVDKIFKN